MDKEQMYIRGIESDKQKFEAYVKRYGYKENLGQIEYGWFRDKINDCKELSYAQKADLCARYTEMLKEI